MAKTKQQGSKKNIKNFKIENHQAHTSVVCLINDGRRRRRSRDDDDARDIFFERVDETR